MLDIWPLSLYGKIFVLITQNLIWHFTMASNKIDALHQNTNTNHNQGIVRLDKLKLACKNEIPYEKLITSVRSGFPESKMKSEPDLKLFWEVLNRLSCSNNLVWFDNRIVIPKSYQSQILNFLTLLISVLTV